MKTKINLEKIQDSQASLQNIEHSDKTQDMEESIKRFLTRLEKSNDKFDAEAAFKELLSYITCYDRILYSTVSNFIYAHYADSGSTDHLGTLQSNLDKLVRYSENAQNIMAQKKSLTSNQKEEAVDDTKKTILKIWDHVTLASQQYTILKQSDAEYDEKFEKRISRYKEEMSKEMNTQLITMVGIFTALAFLIFGSISSLDGIFENLSIPIFKTMSIGLIWGLCVSNLIFIFLYCIGKMTNLNFKADKNPNATIFQKYPIVWWINFILVALLLVTTWGHFIQQSASGIWLTSVITSYPKCSFFIGSIIILIFIILTICFLAKKTKRITQ